MQCKNATGLLRYSKADYHADKANKMDMIVLYKEYMGYTEKPWTYAYKLLTGQTV
jgi:hypothetical protein